MKKRRCRRRSAAAAEKLESARAVRAAAERELYAWDERTRAAARAAADRREGLARLTGSLETAQGPAAAAAAEDEPLAKRRPRRPGSCRGARGRGGCGRRRAGALDAAEVALDARTCRGRSAADAAQGESGSGRGAPARSRSGARGRVGHPRCLAHSLERDDGTAAILADPPAGVLGATAEVSTVTPGCETAVAAALGSLVDGLVAADPGGAAAACSLRQRRRRAVSGERAGAGTHRRAAVASPATLPPGADGPPNSYDRHRSVDPAAAGDLRGACPSCCAPSSSSMTCRRLWRWSKPDPTSPQSRGPVTCSALRSASGGARAPASPLAVRAAFAAGRGAGRCGGGAGDARGSAHMAPRRRRWRSTKRRVKTALSQLHDSDAGDRCLPG